MKRSATRTAAFTTHGMDEALKAGIGATLGSVLILALALILMHTLPVGAAPVARDRLLERTPAGDATPAAWPAPVGHRQPRPDDVLAGRSLKSDFEAVLQRLDRALDDKLRICRGC
jgi:hypothetical protein